MSTRQSEEKTMEHRPFGSTKREVAVDRPGHLVHRAGGSRDGDRRFAPGPRSRHDAYRHGGDVRFGRGGGIGRRGDCRAARRGLPRLQGAAAATRRETGRSPPASGRSSGSGPTGSIAICCTGAARIPLEETVAAFERLRRRQDPVVGRQQFRRATISTRRCQSRAAGKSPAIRCSIICGSARSSTRCIPWCEENGVAVVAYSPFGHAGGFPEPAQRGRAGAEGDRRPA